MKKISKSILIIFVFLFFFVELSSYILGKLNLIPQGISTHISIIADENVSYWHPKNIKLKHHDNTCWRPSTVYYNNIGARGRENVYLKKTKPRIALIGDGMIENITVSDGLDFASLLRKKLKNFEIINFSASSTGLADQIDVYKNLVRKYDVDYVFLFVSENDLKDNHYTNLAQFRIRYKIVDGEVIKIPRSEEWFKIYNSFFNKLKRTKLVLYVKNYSNTFKLYFHLKIKKNLKLKNTLEYKKTKIISDDEKNRKFNENKIIYSFLVDEFFKELEHDKVKHFAFLNIKSYLFKPGKKLDEKKAFTFLKKIWEDKNSFYPLKSSIEYLKERDLYKEPWLSLSCDDSYSEVGSEFMSIYVSDILYKNL